MIDSETQWRKKQEEIIKKFSPDFLTRLRTIPLYKVIFEQLIRDIDPYQIIEFLLNTNYEIQGLLTEFVENNKMPDPIIISTQGWSKEEKDEFIANWKNINKSEVTIV